MNCSRPTASSVRDCELKTDTLVVWGLRGIDVPEAKG